LLHLTSYDPSGSEYVLKMKLGGWDNEPLLSAGVIENNSWGNLPPGEVFTLPQTNSANGQICINGSIPGYPLPPDAFIVLTFQDGRLRHWRAVRSPDAAAFFDCQQHRAKENSDNNWNCLAEIGIGLNTAIQNLNGNPLFDEKAAHTVHIAIGDNEIFGGVTNSHVHFDLVTWKPTLSADNQTILERGQIPKNDLQRERTEWKPEPLKFDQRAFDKRITLNPAEVSIEGGVVRRQLCRANRIGHINMASNAMAKELASLCKVLFEHNGTKVGDLLDQHPRFGQEATETLLSYLLHYRCIILSS
jgi:hypothetical protein